MPPVNDNFANAINIVISESPVVIETDNTGATIEPGEVNYGYGSIWYRINSSNNNLLSINTFETSFDTKISVYTGSSVENLTTIAYNDDSGGGLQSEVFFYAEKDKDYYLSVNGYSVSDFGYIKITVNVVFCSDFFNIYNSNVSSGVAFLAGEKTIAVQDGSYPNYKLLFFEVDDTGYPVYAGQTSLYTSLDGYLSYSEGKVITSKYSSKSLYIHNIDSYNISSVQTVDIGISDLRHPEPGLGTAGQIKLNNDSLIIIFHDIDYNYVFFTAKITESSISYSFSGVTDPILPIDTWFSYPTASCGCAVGTDKAIVCAEIYDETYVDKMVFIAVKSDGVTSRKSSLLQCSDIYGSPISVSSNGDSFCLMYSSGNDIKFVYGEIDNDLNVLFSVPFSLGLAASNISRIGSTVYEGVGNFTFLCSYYKNNSWNTLVSSINIDNFVITRNNTERFFTASPLSIVTFIWSQYLQRNILLTYGSGSFPLSNYGKLYSLSTWKIEDIKEVVAFWKNRILHKEMLSGMLIKQSTLAITPGTPGQPYVPATPAIPSKTTFLHYTKKECKKVG